MVESTVAIPPRHKSQDGVAGQETEMDTATFTGDFRTVTSSI